MRTWMNLFGGVVLALCLAGTALSDVARTRLGCACVLFAVGVLVGASWITEEEGR